MRSQWRPAPPAPSSSLARDHRSNRPTGAPKLKGAEVDRENAILFLGVPRCRTVLFDALQSTMAALVRHRLPTSFPARHLPRSVQAEPEFFPPPAQPRNLGRRVPYVPASGATSPEDDSAQGPPHHARNQPSSAGRQLEALQRLPSPPRCLASRQAPASSSRARRSKSVGEAVRRRPTLPEATRIPPGPAGRFQGKSRTGQVPPRPSPSGLRSSWCS